jgi:hypothetical protein
MSSKVKITMEPLLVGTWFSDCVVLNRFNRVTFIPITWDMSHSWDSVQELRDWIVFIVITFRTSYFVPELVVSFVCTCLAGSTMRSARRPSRPRVTIFSISREFSELQNSNKKAFIDLKMPPLL